MPPVIPDPNETNTLKRYLLFGGQKLGCLLYALGGDGGAQVLVSNMVKST